MKRIDPPIIVEETYNKPIETVWRAITEPVQMRKWFFDNIPDFKPEVGFEIEFDVEAGGRVFPHQWKITKVESGKLIEYNWKYGGYQGDAYVTFELTPEENAIRLRLTNIVVEDFQDDIPEFKRESCIGGWNYFIKERLKKYLDKDSAS
jgi:uncharacterized protein YndB with AHSA1/START domain